jgi:pseudouridine-5'-phosphate glycosidase/pseudouridine kinase
VQIFGSKAKPVSNSITTTSDAETPEDPPLVSDVCLIVPPLMLTDMQPHTQLVVVGSAAVDISARTKAFTAGDVTFSHHSTSPGVVSMTLGGVARNIAETAHRILTSHAAQLSVATMLISPVGDDSFGRLLLDEMHHLGMRTDGLLQEPGARSAVCNMVLDSAGNLTTGVADMDIIQLLNSQTV